MKMKFCVFYVGEMGVTVESIGTGLWQIIYIIIISDTYKHQTPDVRECLLVLQAHLIPTIMYQSYICIIVYV